MRSRRITIICAVGILVLLSLNLLLDGPVPHLDQRVADLVTPVQASVPTRIAEALALLGSWQVGAVVLLGGSVLVGTKRRQWWPPIFALGSLIALAALGIGLKELFGRSGPNIPAESIPWGGAFPSGHTAASVVVAFGLAYLIGSSIPAVNHRMLWVFAFVWALLIGWSRIKLDLHWLSDVVAGWALGTIVICVAIDFVQRWQQSVEP